MLENCEKKISISVYFGEWLLKILEKYRSVIEGKTNIKSFLRFPFGEAVTSFAIHLNSVMSKSFDNQISISYPLALSLDSSLQIRTKNSHIRHVANEWLPFFYHVCLFLIIIILLIVSFLFRLVSVYYQIIILILKSFVRDLSMMRKEIFCWHLKCKLYISIESM